MKYQTAQDIINAFKTEETKQEFLSEWDKTPAQNENYYLKTIRYQVIKGYFDGVEGYDEVLKLLDSHDIVLLRNTDFVYALNDKELNNKIEELNIFCTENQINSRNYYFSKSYLETEEGREIHAHRKAKVQRFSKLFLKHPKIFGKLLEANLTYGAYALKAEDTLLELIKNSTQAPYSANDIIDLFRGIAKDDDLVLYKKIRNANPEYIKEINKTAFMLNYVNFPTSIVYFGRNDQKAPHHVSVNFLSFVQQEGYDNLFSFLIKSGDFPLNGEVQSCYKDILSSLPDSDKKRGEFLIDWERNRYNLYKTQGEKYSRGTYTSHKNANMLFNVFSSHLDQDFDPEDYDKPYEEIKHKAEISTHFNDYLTETIRDGTFLQQMFSNVSSWHAHERGKLNLDGDNILKGFENAINILLQIKNAREIIYGRAEEIISNEKDPFLKSKFFNTLIKHAYTMDEFEVNHKSEPFNPLWIKGKNSTNKKESLNYILETHTNKIPQTVSSKDLSNLSHNLFQLRDKVKHISEKENIVKAMIALANNPIISKKSYLFRENNIIDNRIFDILLNQDLTDNGKFNPFIPLLENDSISNSKTLFFATDEEKEKEKKLRIENNQDKILKYTKNLSKLVKKTIANKSILIPIKDKEAYNDFSKNVIATALDKSNFAGLLLIKSLTKDQIKVILNGDLYNNEDANKIHRDINHSLFKSLQGNVGLKFDANLNGNMMSHRMLEQTIHKLHEVNFDFDIKIDSITDAFKFIKLFAIIQDKELLSSLYQKYETKIVETIKTYSCDEFAINNHSEKEFILNALQNKELFNLFAAKIDISKIEPIISIVDSEKLYSVFLDNTNYDLLSEEDAPILRAIKGHCYKTAYTMIKRNPNTITAASKSKRSVLETAIKDLVLFSTPKGKYQSDEKKDDAIKFIKTAISLDVPLYNDKKVLLNLLETIGKTDICSIKTSSKICISEIDMLNLSKKLIVDNIDYTAKKAGITISDDIDNGSEFKI